MQFFTFIQTQILGMAWLNTLIGHLLTSCSIDLTSRWGNALQFFLYDTLKISILLCALIFTISYIQSYFPPSRTRGILKHYHGIWANLLGALLGTVTPFCSCSSIPLFIGFARAGLPLGVTFSFLISSPMVDLGSLVLLTSIFGFQIALLYVIAGLIIAVLGGVIIEHLHLENAIEDFILEARAKPGLQLPEATLSQRERLACAKEQMLTTFKKVFPYILLGVAIGAIIHNWIPETWITTLLGKTNPFSVPLAVCVGTPLYADIFGTIPVAETLLSKGAALGTILSFMMAVTTLSLPSLILLRKALKPRLLSIFILICVGGILLVGYLFNLFHANLL